MNVFNEIRKWNEDRNLLSYRFDSSLEYKMLKEELDEFRDAPDEHETIDALADIIVVTIGAMYKLGYEPECVISEVLKEINSRVGEIDSNGKFQKDKSPEAKANWYKASYEQCK